MGVKIYRGANCKLFPSHSNEKEIVGLLVSVAQSDTIHNPVTDHPIYICSVKKDSTQIGGHWLNPEETEALIEILTAAIKTAKKLNDPAEENRTTTEDILL